MKDYILVRQGSAPLKFTGDIIGQGSVGNEDSGLTIRIYRTKGGRYVGEIERRNPQTQAFRNADHAPLPIDVIKWLHEGEETLGKASQEAVEKACESDKAFAAAWVEVLD